MKFSETLGACIVRQMYLYTKYTYVLDTITCTENTLNQHTKITNRRESDAQFQNRVILMVSRLIIFV